MKIQNCLNKYIFLQLNLFILLKHSSTPPCCCVAKWSTVVYMAIFFVYCLEILFRSSSIEYFFNSLWCFHDAVYVTWFDKCSSQIWTYLSISHKNLTAVLLQFHLFSQPFVSCSVKKKIFYYFLLNGFRRNFGLFAWMAPLPVIVSECLHINIFLVYYVILWCSAHIQ